MLIGREEARLAAALDKLGMAPIPQQRCGPYRIDVGVWPVAVEVHTMTSSLQRVPTLMRRAAYLMEQGWAMFFLQIGRRDFHSRAPREIHQYQLDVLEDRVPRFWIADYAGLLTYEGTGELRDGELVTDLSFDLDGGYQSLVTSAAFRRLSADQQEQVRLRKLALTWSGQKREGVRATKVTSLRWPYTSKRVFVDTGRPVPPGWRHKEWH